MQCVLLFTSYLGSPEPEISEKVDTVVVCTLLLQMKRGGHGLELPSKYWPRRFLGSKMKKQKKHTRLSKKDCFGSVL